jgi:hypothetical protein
VCSSDLFKITNGDFHFIGVPYTEPKQQEQ